MTIVFNRTFTRALVRPLAFIAAASTLALSGLATAQSTGGPSAAETTPPGAGKAPEQAAIDACQGKKEKERVYFTDAKGKKRHWACVTADGVMAARSGVATAAKTIKPK